MNTRWQQAGQKVKPGFKLAGKLGDAANLLI